MEMRIKSDLLRQMENDLGLNVPYVKGQSISIKNCWHFSTNGNEVDWIFCNHNDFRDGMNRIYVTLTGYDVIILAFALMDTHVHFILYGPFDACNQFMHSYIARTSQYIAMHHGEKNKFMGVSIHHQVIDTDYYLKTAICYTVKNPPVGGLPYMGWNYPWSSGALYYSHPGYWCSPKWTDKPNGGEFYGRRQLNTLLRTKEPLDNVVNIMDGLVFPGEYVAYEIVERLFKTCRSFNYFMCVTKEEDVDSRGGVISRLSIPMQEMRQHKNEVCKELFGKSSVKNLSTAERLRLAKALKSRYNSSWKQIIRLCGLVYDEAKGLII